jgi:HSP20 family protein
MRDEMSQMIDDVVSNLRTQQTSSHYRRPVIETNEHDDEYRITAELPGVNKEDIDIQTDGRTLTIQVEHQETTTNDSDEQTIHQENNRSYYHQMNLPQHADTNKATASYSNGVLELRLPKTNDTTTQRIEIQ